MCPAADLNPCDALPDDDEVARYCKPSEYDHDGRTPKVAAFMKRENEVDVSVNHLQFFHGCGREEAVDCIRREFGVCYDLRPRGRFVVFSVAPAKAAVKAEGFDIRIIYTPKPARPARASRPAQPAQPSHFSIFDLPTDIAEETKAATAIMRLIGQSETYPAVA